MNAGSSTHAKIAPAPQSWVYRHPRWIAGWAILVATGCVLWMALGASDPRLVALLLVLYALQGLIAEGLGVRVSADHISVAAPVLDSAACRCFLAGERVVK